MSTSAVVKREAGVVDRILAVQLSVAGCVQGVGLRPTIARLAAQLDLAGHVRNTPAGVVLVLEGSPAAIDAFVPALGAQLPPEARVRSIERTEIASRGRSGFQICAASVEGAVSAPIPLDMATCPRCLADIAEPGNRRYGYAFTSCTDCGPRYSIIRELPFE
ncbi:MAG TPA: acylphosphatase, partial [Pirellulaceae bacterium]|nr:acylphosphatase [Pirellulaceae bacterium]